MYLTTSYYRRNEKNKAFLSFYAIALLVWVLMLPLTNLCVGTYYPEGAGESISRNFDGYKFIEALFTNEFNIDTLLSLKFITMAILALSALFLILSLLGWTIDMKEKAMDIGCIFLVFAVLLYLIEGILQFNDFNYYLLNLNCTYSIFLIGTVYFGISVLLLIIYLIIKKKMELI